MYMFLTILLAGVPVMILSCLLFVAAARKEKEKAESPPSEAHQAPRAVLAPRFFAGGSAGAEAPSRFDVDALLSEIERHIRLEQAAAESFLDAPTVESLRSQTTSPFMN